MKLIKLTDSIGQTYGGTQWKVGITHTLPLTDDPKLCSKDVLHAYKNINLALLLHPMHAKFNDPRIYEIEAEIAIENWGKVGCFSQTVLRKLPIPDWYKNQPMKNRVIIFFAILCAEAVLKHFEDKNPKDDRPRKAIEAAKEYLANPSVYAAADADYAAYAAYAAAYAAYAAADDAAAAAYSAYAAAYAAYAAADAAYAAADADYAAYAVYAANAAAYAAAYAAYAAEIDFVVLADKAVELALAA